MLNSSPFPRRLPSTFLPYQGALISSPWPAGALVVFLSCCSFVLWCLIGINVVIGSWLVSWCLCQIQVEMKLCVGDEAQRLVVLRVVFMDFLDLGVLFIGFVILSVVVVTFIVFYVVVIGVDVVCCVKY